MNTYFGISSLNKDTFGAMSDGMTGGGWKGGGETDAIDRGLLEFVQEHGKNGVVIDGIIAWIDI